MIFETSWKQTVYWKLKRFYCASLFFLLAPVISVDFSHDGQCILVGSADDTVRLMDKNTGEMLAEYVLNVYHLFCLVAIRWINISFSLDR